MAAVLRRRYRVRRVELHPQVRAIVTAAAAAPEDAWPADLVALRAGYLETALRLGGAVQPVAATEDVVIARADGGRVRARAYVPRPAADPPGAIVWLHGGGWIMGDIEGFDRVSRALANAAGATVVSVEYRLAPEHPYPAAVRDAEAAVEWATGDGAAQLGFEPQRVVVGGDSAGGNLAAVAARHAGAGALRAQMLVYPALDAAMDTPSYRELDNPILTAAQMAQCWGMYLDGHDGADPDASPLRATDLAGVPPAFIAVASDVLRDDGLAYARELERAGVEVELERYDDMVHSFVRWAGVADRARELIDSLGAFARRRLAG
jgi:acetyl esterase